VNEKGSTIKSKAYEVQIHFTMIKKKKKKVEPPIIEKEQMTH